MRCLLKRLATALKVAHKLGMSDTDVLAHRLTDRGVKGALIGGTCEVAFLVNQIHVSG